MGEILYHRYRIGTPLGSGGCAETFLAEDTLSNNKPCVVKKLSPITTNLYALQSIRERFKREASILRTLGRGHDQIPKLYDDFCEDGEYYLVQEWIEGKDRSRIVKEGGPLSEKVVKEILISILRVIEYVHANQIIQGH